MRQMKTRVYVDGFNLYYAIKKHGYKWLDVKRMTELALGADYLVTELAFFTADVSGIGDIQRPQRQKQYLNVLEAIPGITIVKGNFLAKRRWAPIVNLPIRGRVITSQGSSFQVDSANHVMQVAADSSKPKSTVETVWVDSYGTPPKGSPDPSANTLKAAFFTFEEKGSDVNLATCLLRDAYENGFEAAAILTNDTDLAEPMRLVKERLGKRIVLLVPPYVRLPASSLAGASSIVRHVNVSHLNAAVLPDPTVDRHGNMVAKPDGW